MRKPLMLILLLVVLIGFGWVTWEWVFCRFYVGPNQMAVITAKTGAPLPTGQILAKQGQKGILEEVLGEGRHFWNPILYDREIVPVTTIPPGKIGIVTSKVGEELPEGEFLAKSHQKGIWQKVLGPGKYRLNPYGYNIDVVDAISIPIGYAGVITSLSGEQAPSGESAGKGQKGVRKDILQPGLYYVNLKAFKIDVLEIGVNQVSLLGKAGGQVITKGQLETQNVAMEQLQDKVLKEQKRKRLDYFTQKAETERRRRPEQAPTQRQGIQLRRPSGPVQQEEPMPTLVFEQFVEFPSRDGFQISLDMTVEFELLPDQIAWIFRQYGDLPAVVDKVIMPQITSISRNKGSEYRAKDFIVGEGRQKFQTELTRTLAKTLAEKKIIVHNALIRHVVVPAQILDPIQQASIAIEQNLTNMEKQNTAKKLAELNTEITLIEQRRRQVAQETTKLRAEIKADEEKQVAEIEAEAVKRVAEIAKETARVEADTIRKLAEAEAAAFELMEGEKAKGLQMKAEAFRDPAAFGLWEFAQRLNSEVHINILHAGPGTLWTDLEKAGAGDLGGAVLIQQTQRGK